MVKLLTVIIEQLHIVGMRRLMVLSGDDAWVEQQLKQLQVAIDGDWLTISSNLPQGVSLKMRIYYWAVNFYMAFLMYVKGFIVKH